jgi:hypothetical protein
MARRTWILFGIFCVLSSVDWLLPAAPGEGASTLEQLCFLLILIGAGAVSLSRRTMPRANGLLLMVVAVGLLGAPAILLTIASAHLPDLVIAVVFALVPAMIVLANALDDDGSRGLLMPAVLGFAGLLFVLPVNLPDSTEGRLWLAAPLVAALIVAVTSARIYVLVRGLSVSQAAALICVPNALLLLVWCAVTGQFTLRLASFISLSSLVHGAVLVLLVVLLREMVPVRFAARFLIVPLLTVAGGYVLMRPEASWRMVFGFVLAVAGAGWLLSGTGIGEDSPPSLRE